MDNKINLVSLLNNLLEKNCDAKRGYHKAAEEIDQPALKGWLMSLAEQRENFKKSIKEEIRFLGGEPETFRQIDGKVQQAFSNTDLLSLLNNVEQTLQNCLQYELDMLVELEEVLKQKSVIPSTQNLVVGQRENIKLALADLKTIKAKPSYTV